MLRTTKWKVDKPKVKVVFRLQFHATNIPQSGWEKLFVCFIPTESGKITAKTSKANVRNGTCKWADPIYETTRLFIDSRNKRYDDKLYNLIVGMGTSHACILGEATINLADYADASDPFVVSLPLHGSDNGTILHVTVQLLTAKTGFREFEQQFDRGLQSGSNLNRELEPSIATSSSSEFLVTDDHGNKVNTKTHFRTESKELMPIEEETDIHQEYSDSPTVYNDSSSIHEPTDLTGQSLPTEITDLAITRQENQRLKESLKTAESFISELKLELNTLHNHANEMIMETHKISDHLTNEISSGLKLEREIMMLRSECSKFKDELQQLKEIKLRSNFIERPHDHQGFDLGNGQLLSQLNEAKAEKGNLVKKMNEMECYYESLVQELEENRDRILGEFQKLRYEHSTCVYTISNCKSETESIRFCMKDQILKFEKERYDFGCVNEELHKRVLVSEALVQELEENLEQVVGEMKSLTSEHATCGDTVSSCKSKMESMVLDMNDQTLKFAKEKHDLDRVNKELEKRVSEILGEFESFKNEHLTCGDTILICKNETESIRCDLNNQTLKFAKEKHDLSCVNEELEKKVLDLERTRETIMGEFENLKNEHSTCKTEIESVWCDMNNQTLKFAKEKHDLECFIEEIKRNREQILEEFESSKDEHSTCKNETESIHHDMKDQILNFTKEIDDLSCVNDELQKTVSELEKNREQILWEFESLTNEHLTCGKTLLSCKTETHDLKDQILKFTKEIDNMSCVNEELKKTVLELEKDREQILGEYESLKNEHSTCGEIILTCKTETEPIVQDLKDQILKITKERDDLSDKMLKLRKEKDDLISELEKRIKILESALEKGRLNYSIAVTQLQNDLERLSSQVSSMFETNQNLIKQTFSNPLSPNDEKQLSDEIFFANIYLNVYSVILEEKLLEYSQRLKLLQEKNEPERQSESLRLVFMKEKCETTVQELKQQLYVSKRHGDDILIKLQDALDEIEIRKKSEASYLKKIDELMFKIVGFEGELESKRAELDCSVLNLECCKEEKEKIVGLMQKCEEDKLKVVFELSLLQEQISQKENRSILSIMNCCSSFQDLQTQLVQLHKANEELERIYPNLKNLTGEENTLKRVLALEIELAESLMKKKPSIEFQSSFLRQHDDEEAMFKSFRDINELIKDTLEMKGKYVNVETELNEMHERYSELSLKFAEVEGERQKLMMTVRSPRNRARVNRSSSDTVDENLL